MNISIIIMVVILTLMSLFISRGFQRSGSIRHSKIGLSMAATIAPGTTPRIVLNPLPKLYIYDHCPFCVRVRLALGIKNVKHELVFMANDDVSTPTALVGKKIAPIFEVQQKTIVMPESLDIIKRIDYDPDFGQIRVFRPMSDRADLKDWQKKYTDMTRLLQRPR